jgi:hypothetical protein
MISDEPDEDAALDDETAFDIYLGNVPARPSGGATGVTDLPDWPPKASRAVDLRLDGETLAWFQARYTDWRRAMRVVLGGWIAAQRAPIRAIPERPTESAEGRPEDRR